MQVSAYSGDPATARCPLLVFGVFERESPGGKAFATVDRALGGALRKVFVEEHFEGREKQVLMLHTLGRLSARRVACIGLGKRGARPSVASMLLLGSSAARASRAVQADELLLVLPEDCGEPAQLGQVTRGLCLGAYSFRPFKTDRNANKAVSKAALALPNGGRATTAARAAVSRALVVAEAVTMARDLVNEPANRLYPEELAKRAEAQARKLGLRVKTLRQAELERRGMNLLCGVGRGSARPPVLVHLRYSPGRKTSSGASPLVIVGKGITFDSGGLSLKPSPSMENMKCDMAGAAAVLAAMGAIARLRPRVEVHGILALAENMPSGDAIRPGDVLESAAHKTVEIISTDAEGRLVLADALHYAREQRPAAIVDVATLTGASKVALGLSIAALFANDDELATKLAGCAAQAGEHVWRLPLSPLLRDQLRSDIADLKNSGGREGAAITAALFLNEFVGDTPWAHLDIAGPAVGKNEGNEGQKGATGVAVATLVELAERWSEK